MKKTNYAYSKKVAYSFEDAIEKIKAELSKEWFWILANFDIKDTLKKKLNKEIENYMILAACNPENAYKSLQAEKEIGLMLPCNVIVYQNNEDIIISAILPTISMGMIDNKDLKPIAQTIESKLMICIDKV